MMKKYVLLFMLVACSNYLFSQENFSSEENSIYAFNTEVGNSLYQNNNVDFQKYWSFGGNIGLSFWNGGTDILLAPKAYYNISPIFLTGIGISYMYSNYNSGLQDYKSNSFGGSVMAAVRPIQFLQLSAEYEGLQTNRTGYYKEAFWNNALFLGVSFISGNVSIGLRYDVLFDDVRSSYSSALTPVVGFYF